jgi:peptidoglycan-N-acetylglucosamine deacetylase
MIFFRPCFIAGWLYPEAIFRIKSQGKLLCLTFDDGPDPESTFPLLEILDRYNIKGYFFCDGRAAEKYPELVSLIISKGHVIGNHGYAHPDGWKISSGKYAEDILKASKHTSYEYFRPPFGRLRLCQYRRLKKKYKIFFWDIMPYDFDRNFGSERALTLLKNKIRPGSIIVLHDRPSSSAIEILPPFIDFALSGGYRFVKPGLIEYQ